MLNISASLLIAFLGILFIVQFIWFLVTFYIYKVAFRWQKNMFYQV